MRSILSLTCITFSLLGWNTSWAREPKIEQATPPIITDLTHGPSIPVISKNHNWTQYAAATPVLQRDPLASPSTPVYSRSRPTSIVLSHQRLAQLIAEAELLLKSFSDLLVSSADTVNWAALNATRAIMTAQSALKAVILDNNRGFLSNAKRQALEPLVIAYDNLLKNATAATATVRDGARTKNVPLIRFQTTSTVAKTARGITNLGEQVQFDGLSPFAIPLPIGSSVAASWGGEAITGYPPEKRVGTVLSADAEGNLIVDYSGNAEPYSPLTFKGSSHLFTIIPSDGTKSVFARADDQLRPNKAVNVVSVE